VRITPLRRQSKSPHHISQHVLTKFQKRCKLQGLGSRLGNILSKALVVPLSRVAYSNAQGLRRLSGNSGS